MSTPQNTACNDFFGATGNIIIGLINGSSKGGCEPLYVDDKKLDFSVPFESHNILNYFKKTLGLFELIHNNTKDSHEKIPPLWYTTNSFKEIMMPVNFDGPTEVSKYLYQSTDSFFYASHQIIRRWDSAIICAILGSKKPWRSKQNSKKNETLIDSSLSSASDVEYLKSRGAISEFGNNSSEYVRWIVPYKTATGQNAFIFISGDMIFLNGSVDLIPQFKSLISYKLKKQDNTNSAVELIDNTDIFTDPTGLELIGNEISTIRLISASVVVHDYLCYLKNKEGIEDVIEVDYASDQKFKYVNINDVINMYSKIKKYLTVLDAYSLIQ